MQGTGESGDPVVMTSRAVRLVRVVVLLCAGLVIAFSATLHEQLVFDRTVAAASLLALALAHLIAWLRTPQRSAVMLLVAVCALVAGVAVLFTAQVPAFALVVAAWALVNGLLEFVAVKLNQSHRGDGLLMGALGVLLALLVLLVRNDPVAIIGFFGAYAVIGGVFLGISAFDRRDTEPEAATA